VKVLHVTAQLTTNTEDLLQNTDNT